MHHAFQIADSENGVELSRTAALKLIATVPAAGRAIDRV